MVRVRWSASSSIQPTMSTSPESCCCTTAQTSPAASRVSRAAIAARGRAILPEHLIEAAGEATDPAASALSAEAGEVVPLRALLADAPLVLLDEPTANVAASSVPALHGVITELAVEQMRTGVPVRFRTASGGVRLEGVLVECGEDGRATRCEPVRAELPT